jgi:hypothetical protein
MATGGRRDNAGRKPKADEDRIRGLAVGALVKIYGSEEQAFEHLAKMAKESFPHVNLLFAYAYGKPQDKLDVTSGGKRVKNIFTPAAGCEPLANE